MTAFSTWSSPVIDQNTAARLHIFLPFVGALLVSCIIYVWLNKTGRLFAGFSPTVASILTAPLLAAFYFILSTKDFVRGSMGTSLARTLSDFVLLGPLLLILSPLLLIYLRGGFPRRRVTDVMLCVATLAGLFLEVLWLYLLFGRKS